MELTPFTLDPSSKIALVLQGGPISIHTQVDFVTKGPDLSFSHWACIYSLIQGFFHVLLYILFLNHEMQK